MKIKYTVKNKNYILKVKDINVFSIKVLIYRKYSFLGGILKIKFLINTLELDEDEIGTNDIVTILNKIAKDELGE